ncbi:uncharacterized protein LOC119101687 [Pollicipes pollicipes]|uniref:uncharacterized protein LOC119101687 n=1 Tax=Pollicipes pollicipes TaxID=41117 RepID=UPI0018859E50|nr:uncharacterized protein LOC119101687 [Pollicipes pollicipes]
MSAGSARPWSALLWLRLIAVSALLQAGDPSAADVAAAAVAVAVARNRSADDPGAHLIRADALMPVRRGGLGAVLGRGWRAAGGLGRPKGAAMQPSGRRLTAYLVAMTAVQVVSAQSQAYDYDIMSFQDASDLDTGQVTPVTAVTGGVAELPCHVEPDASRDVMRLMLWYKDSTGAPFYSYDTRGRKSTRGTHWANEDSLGQRSEFDPRPQAPLLRIKHVEEGDQGVYRCRADFRTSPTFNARVNLTVVVPPQQPRLFNEPAA